MSDKMRELNQADCRRPKEIGLTQEYLLSIFEYQDGRLIWKERPMSDFRTSRGYNLFIHKHAGKEAGCIDKGYHRVVIGKTIFPSHRLIFFMHYGYFPEVIDHIDGNPSNNRLDNLRAATIKQNARNVKTPKNNTSGVKGVYFHKAINKWTASVKIEGRLKHLGVFEAMEDAISARKLAACSAYGEFATDR